jgi:triosephosphate isomerase (TIM)
MRQSLVIGNWKMHGNLSANDKLLSDLIPRLANGVKSQVVICPPTIYLQNVSGKIINSQLVLGAQNVCAESAASGAFTGEVSAEMLVDFAVRYVIVGHSERRQYYAENNEVVAQKFLQAQSAGLIPVLCVGENLQQREKAETLAFITAQLMAVVNKAGIEAFSNAVIAYEPIWAIGTGKTASPEQAQEVHAHIRQEISKSSKEIAEKIQLLYGGSVKADNARSLFLMADIDGALVGGASLNADDFSVICKAAE